MERIRFSFGPRAGEAIPLPGTGPTRRRARGFTLIEMGIVLLIIGIILGMGTASWVSYASARKVVMTAGTMRRAKDCLVRHIMSERMYPGYSSGQDFQDTNTFSVDACLNGKLDGWGRQICYIQGRYDDSNGLDQNYCLLVNETTLDSTDPCCSKHSTSPPVKPYLTSKIIDDDGNEVGDVAFVLVSMGADGVPNNDTYSGLFPNMDGRYEDGGSTSTSPWADVMTNGTSPNFSDETATGGTPPSTLGDPDDEDIYLVVTYSELLAELAETRQ